VFLHVTDPVAEGFAQSLAYPGGNMTGFGEFFADVLAKRMEFFKELGAWVTGYRWQVESTSR
jgi:ABC-type uncharacterized transport system substrate-binding protein